MDIEIHLQVWEELKPHLIGGDVEAAAEDFLRVLVEHGADAAEIAKYALDSQLKLALSEYTDVDEDHDPHHDTDEYDHDDG